LHFELNFLEKIDLVLVLVFEALAKGTGLSGCCCYLEALSNYALGVSEGWVSDHLRDFFNGRHPGPFLLMIIASQIEVVIIRFDPKDLPFVILLLVK
jgi:hypothetical protein